MLSETPSPELDQPDEVDDYGCETSSGPLICHGSCHCGAIRVEAVIDAREGTRKCNCSYCAKTRFWKVLTARGQLRIVSGNKALANYRFGEELVRHCFCSRCGVSLFTESDLGDPVHDVCAINVACLDDDAVDVLNSMPVHFENGRHDDWWSKPVETRHL